jgi:iron only hydrogenase large subunit-like protein
MESGEADRPWFACADGDREVDHVVTTVELANIFKLQGIDLKVIA